MGFRDFFLGNAKKRCEHAILSDEYASRYDQACINEFRKIHHLLQEIENRLPPDAPGKSTAGIDRSLTYMRDHAERTLVHLRDLSAHLERFKQKLDESNR